MKGGVVAAALATSAVAAPYMGAVEQLVLDGSNIVDSHKLQGHIHEDGLRKRAEDLYAIAKKSVDEYGHPTRVIGSAGHNATLEYIQASLDKLDYYDVNTQIFSAITGNVKSYELKVNGKVVKEAEPFSLTPSTPDSKPLTANLAVASNYGCLPTDYRDSEGQVVLVRRGECPFGVKSETAGVVGAGAIIIYDPDSNDTFHGTLGTPMGHEVATFGVPSFVGNKLAADIEAGKTVEITASMDATVDIVNTVNVVAETRGGDKDNVVMLGAHSDSVAEGPGINDDGSGTISLLEVASALTHYEVNNAVRFAWWSAEEEGLLGSEAYAKALTQSENQKVRLFMDYDMMASPNYAYQIYDANNDVNPNGSGDLKQLYIDFYESAGVNYTFVPFDGRSDYVGFLDVGIPAGGVATGAEELKTADDVAKFGGEEGVAFDRCYHQLCDDLKNPDYEAWVVNTKLIAHSVATYAKSFDGFPEREKPQYGVSAVSESFPYRGPKLIM